MNAVKLNSATVRGNSEPSCIYDRKYGLFFVLFMWNNLKPFLKMSSLAFGEISIIIVRFFFFCQPESALTVFVVLC